MRHPSETRRMCYRQLLLFENPCAVRERVRREPTNSYRYVREVKGGAWQSRVWLGHVSASLNLGLFTLAENNNDGREAEWSAARASREFIRRWIPGKTVGMVVEELKRLGYVPEGVVVPLDVVGETPAAIEDPCERRERLARDRLRRLDRRRYAGRNLITAIRRAA